MQTRLTQARLEAHAGRVPVQGTLPDKEANPTYRLEKEEGEPEALPYGLTPHRPGPGESEFHYPPEPAPGVPADWFPHRR